MNVKLTDSNGQTKNNMQWGNGVIHTATGNNPDLCSNGWIHFYSNPLIAVLMNPIHANFAPPQMWECIPSGEIKHESLKSGSKSLKTIRLIDTPTVTTLQRVVFAILCTKQIENSIAWNNWAGNYLSGLNRSKCTAYAAAHAVYSVYSAAAYSAYSATNAVYSAADAVYSVYSATATNADAAYSVYSATNAAKAAAEAASYADKIDLKINFILLAEEAITYK